MGVQLLWNGNFQKTEEVSTNSSQKRVSFEQQVEFNHPMKKFQWFEFCGFCQVHKFIKHFLAHLANICSSNSM